MPFFGQELFEQAQAKGPLTDAGLPAREEPRRRQLAGRDGLLATLDGQKLDALIAPAMAPAWPTDHVLGDHFVGAGYGMAAVAGTPSLTVPMGETHGLPLGLAFMGRAYSEAALLGCGYAFEQKTKARKAPTFKPTSSSTPAQRSNSMWCDELPVRNRRARCAGEFVGAAAGLEAGHLRIPAAAAQDLRPARTRRAARRASAQTTRRCRPGRSARPSRG